MADSELKQDFISVINRALKGKSNPVVYDRIIGRIERLEDNPRSVSEVIESVTTVIRLLMDEELSDDIKEVLRSIALEAGYVLESDEK